MEAEDLGLDTQRDLQGVYRYYELAKRAEWQVRDLPWGEIPPIPEYSGSPQKLARRRDLWRSVITQQLQADELAVEMATQLFSIAPDHEAKLYYTTMGHVHFCVADIPSTVAFWEGLGFELMAQLREQAAFLASGGYHHHVGANTWQSQGAPYAPDDRARLVGATIHGAPEARETTDPSGIPLTFTTAD